MAMKLNLSTSDVEELGRVLSRLNMKNIPTWDPVYGEQKTIKSHLKSFEIAIGGAKLDNEDKARELIGSLRGQALSLVENLSDAERKDYEGLKRELIEVFHKEKSIDALIQEFYGMKWIQKQQTIREFALALKLTWMKIVKDDDENNKKTSNAILNSRLIQGILEADPKFGEILQFTTDNETNFDNLAIEAEQKYDRFKITQERIEEHEWESEPAMLNKSRLSDSEREDRDNQENEDDHFWPRTRNHGNQRIYRQSLVDDGRNQLDDKYWPQEESTYNDMNHSHQRRNDIDKSGVRFSHQTNQQAWYDADSECFQGTNFQNDATNLDFERPSNYSGFQGIYNQSDDNLDQDDQETYVKEDRFNHAENESFDPILQQKQYGSVNEDHENDNEDYEEEYDVNDEYDEDYGGEYGRHDVEYDDNDEVNEDYWGIVDGEVYDENDIFDEDYGEEYGRHDDEYDGNDDFNEEYGEGFYLNDESDEYQEECGRDEEEYDEHHESDADYGEEWRRREECDYWWNDV